MLGWDQFFTYSLFIVTFLLTAPRPSHALPVNPPALPTPCKDGGPPPCICDKRLSLIGNQKLREHGCNLETEGIHFKSPSIDDSYDIVWVSHLFFHWRFGCPYLTLSDIGVEKPR
jgi:hypothetical protein